MAFCLALPSPVFSATETYDQACKNAYDNAASPGNWLASNLVTIPLTPNPGNNQYGLQYDTGGNIIVRTATYSSYYTNNYVGQANYKIVPTAAWVTTGNEFTNFYNTYGVGATNADLIKFIERSVGMNTDGSHDAIVEYAVTTDSGKTLNDKLLRPTRNPDITTYNSGDYGSGKPFPSKPSTISDATWTSFQTFYTNQQTDSAPGEKNQFPWTQLGYTYYWGKGQSPPENLAQIQGLSEFVILKDSAVNIYGIYATPSYIYAMNPSTGQYGNGYANFNITGQCNTVWAGHSYQYNVSRDASSPNQINVIGPAGNVSGKEGILVWSLNYTVTVDSGCTVTSDGTSLKDYVDGTNNIGIFFDGDTSTTWGDPITVGVNKVDNSGTIRGGPLGTGIAIQVWHGDMVIINRAGGYIGDQTAIDCSNSTGAVSITNRGTISGPITLNAASLATFDIENTSLTVTGGALSSFTVGANSATDYGVLNTTGTTANANTTVTLTPGGYIPNNTSMTVMTASAGSISAVPGTINSASPVFSVSGAISSNNLVLTAKRVNYYNSFASSSNADAAGSVLNTLAMNNSATGDMVTVLGSLDSLTSGGQINSALNSLSPNVDNSAPQVSGTTQQQFVSTVLAHLDGFKNVMGSMLKGVDVWTSGFGSYIHQDEMSFSNGYDASIWGTALGFDIPALDNFRVGLSGGFAQDFVRTKDFSNKTDIDSYQGTLYTSYAKGVYFIDTAVSFAYNSYNAQRQVAFGLLNRTAKGDYNGQQYSGYIQGGYKFTGKGIELTPIASFLYSHLRLNGYTESGAGAANLKVDPQDYDIAQTGLGMKIGYPLELKKIDTKVTPEFKFKWFYDWVGDAQQTTSTFTGGGGSFGTKGFIPAQSSYDFGLKLTVETVNNITLSLSYDLEIKEDYYGHYGYGELRYRF
ncbi:MAG: autotransporter outer membrane beta-barrel domain-containing protein [Candidatus Omnitrophica bacterium]|nr:autotransporter outer membrane beta-barrel domain-containing protein [Candidatus Omnitrophota bacterium]